MKATKGYRLIIFDWDGTVLDSLPKMAACYRFALQIMDQPEPDADLLRQVAGRGWHLAMPAILPGMDDILYQDLATIYHQLWRRGGLPEPDLIAGAEALLQDLLQRGFLLAIATSRARRSIERDSQAFGLRHYFHTVRGFDDTQPKPHPAMLHSILEELAIPAEQALMVGDTDTDVHMALNAGVDACGVISGGLSRPEFEEMGAALVLEDITGLQAFLPDRAPTPPQNELKPEKEHAETDRTGRITDREGVTWLVKAVADTERRLLEYAAFHGYRALGLACCECRLAEELSFEDGTLPDGAGDVLFIRPTPYVDIQNLLTNTGADEHAEIKEKVSRGFVADCLFANHAMFATPVTSITIDERGEICRTAVETALKLEEDGDIALIDDARNGDLWPKAVFFFGEVHKRDLIAQIGHIEANRSRLVPQMPREHQARADRIRDLLDRRVAMLLAYRDRLLQERDAYHEAIDVQFQNPQATVVFDKAFDSGGLAFNDVPFDEHEPVSTQPAAIDEPPFVLERGQQPAAGIVVVEADERVWIYEPLNHHGSHQHAFPKGQVEGESHLPADLHRTAMRETWEEVGIHARITGFLADLNFYNHQTRYYLGERIGGDPCQAHWEAARVKLVPMAELHRYVNIENDRALLRHLLEHCGKPLFVPPLATPAGTSQAHRWRGIQGGLTTIDRETAGATRGRWFEDESGAQWFMKRDLFVQGLQTSAEVVAARIYDFFGYQVPETQKMVAGDSHLVFARDVGAVRHVTDFTGLDHAAIRRLRVVAAYLNDWARIGNAMDNLVTEDGKLYLIDFGATLGVRSRGRLKPGPTFGRHVGYFPATRDFWVFYDEYEVRREASHPWQRLKLEDLSPLIARFQELHDAIIDEIVAAAQYPTDDDAAQVVRALKWRRDAVITGAADYFSGKGVRTGQTPTRKKEAEPGSAYAEWPSLGRIAEVLATESGCITHDAVNDRLVFDTGEGSGSVASLLRYLERRLPAIHSAEQIPIAGEVMRRHWRAFFTADLDIRYLINVSGLYDAQGKGNGTDLGVTGDAMSLRQYTSYLFYPMNALFRLDLDAPESVPALRGMYQVAARNFFRIRGVHPRLPLGENLIRLYDFAASITGRDDPGLWRLVREQLLHNLMATRALLRQAPLDPAHHPHLYRIVDLDETGLARYRRNLATTTGLVAEYAFTSTSVDETRSDLHSRRDKRFKFIITPLAEGTRGRYLDGRVDNVVSASEQEVLYPPGTSFRVTHIDEAMTGDTTRDGQPRMHIHLQEAAAGGTVPKEAGQNPGTP